MLCAAYLCERRIGAGGGMLGYEVRRMSGAWARMGCLDILVATQGYLDSPRGDDNRSAGEIISTSRGCATPAARWTEHAAHGWGGRRRLASLVDRSIELRRSRVANVKIQERLSDGKRDHRSCSGPLHLTGRSRSSYALRRASRLRARACARPLGRYRRQQRRRRAAFAGALPTCTTRTWDEARVPSPGA